MPTLPCRCSGLYIPTLLRFLHRMPSLQCVSRHNYTSTLLPTTPANASRQVQSMGNIASTCKLYTTLVHRLGPWDSQGCIGSSILQAVIGREYANEAMTCLACSERDIGQRWPARSAILRSAGNDHQGPAQAPKPVKEAAPIQGRCVHPVAVAVIDTHFLSRCSSYRPRRSWTTTFRSGQMGLRSCNRYARTRSCMTTDGSTWRHTRLRLQSQKERARKRISTWNRNTRGTTPCVFSVLSLSSSS